MRTMICLISAAVVCVSSTPVAAHPAKHTTFQLNETTWHFADKKLGKLQESIDASGNYISQTMRGKHVDHGTAVMKNDKACFTSAMTKDGELCWTVRPVAVGHSIVAVNDKGGKLKVTRVKYSAMSMPK